jgi:hypothetical protein
MRSNLHAVTAHSANIVGICLLKTTGHRAAHSAAALPCFIMAKKRDQRIWRKWHNHAI